MRKNRKNNSRTWGNRICIAAFLLTCSLMLGGCGVKKEKEADSELPKIVIGMDYFERGVCIIEWGNQIEELLPPHTIHIDIKKNKEDIHTRYFYIRRN